MPKCSTSIIMTDYRHFRANNEGFCYNFFCIIDRIIVTNDQIINIIFKVKNAIDFFTSNISIYSLTKKKSNGEYI